MEFITFITFIITFHACHRQMAYFGFVKRHFIIFKIANRFYLYNYTKVEFTFFICFY